MPAERVAMRQAREIIHLKFSACVPTREIARRLGIAASTVRETLRRLESTGLNWPLPDDMTDGKLETALYTNRGTKQGHRRHAEPDWPMVHRELKRKHVTLLIVWDEYIAENPGGYSYSRFCELYRAFESRLPVTMRQTHAAGERLFVDYAGDGVPVVIDRLTGEIRKGQIFVAVLGASSFTYARATWTQTLVDWIDAHVQTFGAIGGAPHLLVPDNTKAAVVKACLYDPLVNRTYADMAAHYGTAILPARACAEPVRSKIKKVDHTASPMPEIHQPARLVTRAASFRYGGRHHPGIPGGIIPLYPGGFVGIGNGLRSGRCCPTRRRAPL